MRKKYPYDCFVLRGSYHYLLMPQLSPSFCVLGTLDPQWNLIHSLSIVSTQIITDDFMSDPPISIIEIFFLTFKRFLYHVSLIQQLNVAVFTTWFLPVWYQAVAQGSILLHTMPINLPSLLEECNFLNATCVHKCDTSIIYTYVYIYIYVIYIVC